MGRSHFNQPAFNLDLDMVRGLSETLALFYTWVSVILVNDLCVDRVKGIS